MGGFQDILRRVFSQRSTWYALAWALTLLVAQILMVAAWHAFDNYYAHNRRNDGNSGHTTIDFGGQYLMGKLLLEGHGHDLHNRTRQRFALYDMYPVADQDPEAKRSDVENMMFWMMGSDEPEAAEAFASFLTPLATTDAPSAAVLLAAGREHWTERPFRPGTPEAFAAAVAPLAAQDGLGAAAYLAAAEDGWRERPLDHARARRVGGPLYPPINAFLNAPLALLPLRTAYRVQQVLNLLLAFVAGLGISVITRREVWWPVATLFIFVFPGYIGSIDLAQNATLTLAILVWGWALLARARPGWGGLVWGLLAFKPVWAMVFFFVLMLTRRWRDGLAMLAVGAALGLATLPFVGVRTWLEWLQVGRDAAALYNTDHNWVFLSRDLLGTPRRWLLVFEDGAGKELERHAGPNSPSFWWYWLCGGGAISGWLVPALAGWGLLLAVLEGTVRLTVLRKEQARAVTGPPAAFLLLGAWLCCFHFMYYDVLLAAFPVLLLFDEPRRYLEPLYLTNVPLSRLTAGAAATRWHHPERGETGRLGVAAGVLAVALVARGVLVLGLGIAAFRLGLPWPVLLPPLVGTAATLAAFVGVGAVAVARLARPLVPPPQYRSVSVLNRVPPTLFVLVLLTQPLGPVLHIGSYFGPPWDTWLLMLIWLWAGWYWLRTKPPPAERKRPEPAAKPAAARLALPV